MDESHYVGAYWLARPESVEECARRAEAFFRLLAPCDPLLSRWFRKGWTLEEALQNHFEPSMEAFVRIFSQKKEEYPPGGVRLGVWNGDVNDAVSASVDCGEASVWVPNSSLVRLPAEGPAAERLFQVSTLCQILRAMVLAWEPEWGVATSGSHRDRVSDSGSAGTFVGWVTYFSHRRGPIPALPPPVRVEPVEDKGSLIILTPERISTEHVELARTVTGLLDQAGLIGPLKPWDA
jgi:hypothetical protein